MKPLQDNTGAQACNQSGTNITLSQSSSSSPPPPSSSPSSSLTKNSNDHTKSATTTTVMASSFAHDNGSIISSNLNNNNNNNNNNNSKNKNNDSSGCHTSNHSKKDKEKTASGSHNGLTKTPTSTTTKMNDDSATSSLSVVTNGNSSSYSNGYHSDNNKSPNNNNRNATNGGTHYHHPHSHYHFPQHSPNGIDAAAAAAAVLNVPETNDSRPIFLDYSCKDEDNDLLTSINSLRKQGQFCDIKLLVEEHELPAHRAVLAASSPYLFDFLSCLEETECLQPIYRVKDVPYVGFQHLLDYMYTGRLHVPLSQVPVVYGTALVLRMEAPTRACADFLSSHLTEANCLVIRRFSRDNDFRSAVDEYIRGHIDEILNSKSFFGLTNLQVEVVGLDESIEDETMERRLFSLVLDWAKMNLNDLKPKMDRLTEQVNVLYLNPDNTLMDCADMEDSVLSSDDDVVMDYKKMARRRSKTKSSSQRGSSSSNGGSGQPFHKFSLNPEEAVSVAEREWSIIATRKTNENAYLSIAVLDGQLMAVSVHLRPSVPPSTEGNGSITAPDSPTSVCQNGRGTSPILRKASIAPLECMSTARCAMGAVELDGQIVVYGGYDRGECLQSVETFTLQDNQWTKLSPMNAARGRFSAAALGGYVYMCGGSDGWKELSSVERYEPSTGQWKFVANMIKERSSHGVATLNGKLYCIGGSDGQRSLADCEMYDPETNKWTRIASLNSARTQTCVCAFQDMLYAIGGTDSWNTLNSVEMYDPEQGTWILSSNLNIARRGAGVDIVDDMMVVVGGSDGTQSLTSVEFYNPTTDQWTVGPPMITPRANLSAVTVGNRLFAIGGFSGKKFLSTVEWLDIEGKEWLGHAPKVADLNSSHESSEEELKVAKKESRDMVA